MKRVEITIRVVVDVAPFHVAPGDSLLSSCVGQLAGWLRSAKGDLWRFAMGGNSTPDVEIISATLTEIPDPPQLDGFGHSIQKV